MGTFDEQTLFGDPQMAILTGEMQSFHHLPAGAKAFERGPGSWGATGGSGPPQRDPDPC